MQQGNSKRLSFMQRLATRPHIRLDPSCPLHRLIVLKQNPLVLKQRNVEVLHRWQAVKTTLGCTDTQLLGMLGATRNLMSLKLETIE